MVYRHYWITYTLIYWCVKRNPFGCENAEGQLLQRLIITLVEARMNICRGFRGGNVMGEKSGDRQ